MSKVILNHITKGKELKCQICDDTKSFHHEKVEITCLNSENQQSKESLEKFTCCCGWTVLIDNVGKTIKEDVWNENYEGAIVIDKF